MTGAVFVRPVGYDRFCRLAVVGVERHATACLASIPAGEPVLITARRPVELCSACREDLRVRTSRAEDLTPYARQIGARAALTTERAAEELFGPLEAPEPVTSRTVTPDLRRPAVELDVETLLGPEGSAFDHLADARGEWEER